MKKLYILLALGMLAMISPSQALPNILSLPNPLVRDKVSVTDVNDRLVELERRFNQSIGASTTGTHSDHVSNFESRLNELQEQLQGLSSLKADNNETKQKVAQIESRLQMINKELSSVSVVKTGLDILDAKVTAESEETMKKIENLQTEVGAFKTQIQETENNFDSRMEELQGQLGELTGLETDHEETKQKVAQMTSRLETVETELSSFPGVKSGLNDLEAKVDADSEHKKKMIENLQVEVGGFKSQIQGAEKDITEINAEIQKLKKHHETEVVPSTGEPGCPSEYHHNKNVGICMKYFTSAMNINGARQHCAKIGSRGSMVILDTRDRMKAALMYLYEGVVEPIAFVGGQKVKDEYLWLNGEMIDSWCLGYPRQMQPCVALGHFGGKDLCLADMPCDSALPFICQVTLTKK